MSAALGHVGIDRQPTEELSFAEVEEQQVELLPSRTVLSIRKAGPVEDIRDALLASLDALKHEIGL